MTQSADAMTMKLDDAGRRERLEWIRINDDDLARVRAVADILRPEAKQIVKEFYDHSFKFSAFTAKVNVSGSNRERLEAAQADYFVKILDGKVDDAYFAQRLRIGSTHARLNIEPRWNVGNYAYYAELVGQRLADKLKGKELAATLISFQKMFILDATLAMETYVRDGLLMSLAESYDTLNESSSSLAATTTEVTSATAEIARAVEEVAQGASTQTESMNAINEDMETLGSAIESVANGAQEQADGVKAAQEVTKEVGEGLANVTSAASSAREKSATSLEAAENGMNSVKKTVSSMETIREAVMGAAGQIGELGERGKEIGAIIDVIDDIAGQTNLLALNAAIEAARAGEQGRGFAVVAENVRSLAERTAQATKEIGELISAVQAGTDAAVAAMNSSVADVEDGSTQAQEAGEALGAIVDAATMVGDEVAKIADSAAQMNQSSAALEKMMSDVGTISDKVTGYTEEMLEVNRRVSSAVMAATSVAEESAAAAQEVSASVQEVTAQVAEVSSLSDTLGEDATAMGTVLEKFDAMADLREAMNARGKAKPEAA